VRQLSDSDAPKTAGNALWSMTDTSVSPLRSRKGSLSAVIDKLRLQHNPDDVLPGESNVSNEPVGNGTPYDAEELGKKLIDFKQGLAHRLDLQGQSNFLDVFVEENGSASPRVNEDDPQGDPFQQGELNDDADDLGNEFVRPFPPSRLRTFRNDSDMTSPTSPSVSVHIVNVSSPLSFQQTRSPLANHSSISQASPCLIDDNLMDEALVGMRK